MFSDKWELLKMNETEDIDPFAYKPLKVTKKRTSVSPSVNSPTNKKQRTGTQRRRSGVRSQKSPLPSQKGPDIVQLFTRMKSTPVKVQKKLSGNFLVDQF